MELQVLAPLKKDGYKTGHADQYPNHTTLVYSNFTARKTRVEGQTHVVNFGMQYFCLEYLIADYQKNFFGLPKDVALKKYARRMKNYLGRQPRTERMAALHDLGYLPLSLKTMPEGSLVPMRVANTTITSTRPEFFWLTNDIETLLSDVTWGMITSATTASRFRKVLNEFADRTVGNRDFVPFQGHDFSMRGMSSFESACTSGAAHLMSFVGTDTIPAIDFLETYYGADSDKELVGTSIDATEHAVMCAGGMESEYDTYLRLLTEVYPSGPVSVVSDTWDFWGVLTNILPRLKEVILARPANEIGLPGKLVIRPDSGDGVETIAGKAVPLRLSPGSKLARELVRGGKGSVAGSDGGVLATVYEDLFKNRHLEQGELVFFVVNEGVYFKVEVLDDGREAGVPFRCSWEEVPSAPELKGTIETLWDLFGGTKTARGYKLLNEHIGAILGEGVGVRNLSEILTRLEMKGFASINCVFGIGSYAYQYATRDTYGLAMKATFCIVDGQERNIFKNPKTDVGGMKKSAKGRLRIDLVDGDFVMRDEVSAEEEAGGALIEIFRDGKMTHLTTMAEIRARLAKHMDAPPEADLSRVSASPSQPATGFTAKRG